MMCRLLLLLSLLFSLPCLAQGYRVEGSCDKPTKGYCTLTIFLPDGSTFRQQSLVRKGSFSFSGTIPEPCVATINYPHCEQPLYFFLENADISISLNFSSPQTSPITGSRSNSTYRIALEDCSYSTDPACLKEHVRSHPASIFSPFILWQHFQQWGLDESAALLQTFEKEATHTYHYHFLNSLFSRLAQLQVGNHMPDFEFPSPQKATSHLDSIAHDSLQLLIVVAASWCHDSIPSNPNWKQLRINIDDDPRGWDTPFLQELCIDHIPYLILLSPTNTILATDVRPWQLERLTRHIK